MKGHVTSLEMSKKLAEAGVSPKSINTEVYHFFYRSRKGYYELVSIEEPFDFSWLTTDYEAPTYPAYLLSELLEMVEGLEAIYPYRGRWCADLESDRLGEGTFEADTPIETVAAVILWQKRQEK